MKIFHKNWPQNMDLKAVLYLVLFILKNMQNIKSHKNFLKEYLFIGCHLFIFIFNFHLFVFPCHASKSAFTFPSSPLMCISNGLLWLPQWRSQMFFMFSKHFFVLSLNVSPGEEPFLLHSVYLNTIHSTELDNFIITTDSYYRQ